MRYSSCAVEIWPFLISLSKFWLSPPALKAKNYFSFAFAAGVISNLNLLERGGKGMHARSVVHALCPSPLLCFLLFGVCAVVRGEGDLLIGLIAATKYYHRHSNSRCVNSMTIILLPLNSRATSHWLPSPTTTSVHNQYYLLLSVAKWWINKKTHLKSLILPGQGARFPVWHWQLAFHF